MRRVRTKLEVFDWLMKNRDKRVGKNPAGYLVSSIRSDYQAPPDFTAAEAKTKAAGKAAEKAEAGRRRRPEAKRRKAKDEAERAKARETLLRDRWERPPRFRSRRDRRGGEGGEPGRRPVQDHARALLSRRAREAACVEGPGHQKGLFPDLD